jgi:DNA-directed RNA polymerase subunit alpha
MNSLLESWHMLPEIQRSKRKDTYASYNIEPLEAGYGWTLGNALKRVLLSSLPGVAVTSIRMKGVQREFQDIPGVVEHVTDIVLNIKQLRLRSSSDQPVTMHLKAAGKRIVTAADIMTPNIVEIMNPELHIATLDKEDARLDMELVVERGRGYAPAALREDQPLGVIPLDAIYTPLQKADYRVEHTRVGKMTNYDKIVLEITTDGTITPDEALQQSAEILVQQFRQLSMQLNQPLPVEPCKHAASSNLLIPQEIYHLPLEALGLSIKVFNSLKRHGRITKIGQLLELDEEDLLSIRHIGVKALQEIGERLLNTGYIPVLTESTHPSERTPNEEEARSL